MIVNPFGPTPLLSRRASLGALASAPISSIVLACSEEAHDRELPTRLTRTAKGRALSRTRYGNAEIFFVAIEKRLFSDTRDLLYQTGIVAQLALTSHLLDVGFDDRWCARHIGLHIGKALAYANETGLNYKSPTLERLVPALSPYNVWHNPDLDGSRPPIPTSLPEIPPLLRDLLDHVRGVTGHPRPRRRQTHG